MSLGQTEIRNSTNKKSVLCVWNAPQDTGMVVCCVQFCGLEVEKCFQVGPLCALAVEDGINLGNQF